MKRESDKKWNESKKFQFAVLSLILLILVYVDTMHLTPTDKVAANMPAILEMIGLLKLTIGSCLGLYGVAQGIEKWKEKAAQTFEERQP